MNCPNCSEVLVMSERQGVEIDYCPKCRGVWLDKGELDKIIEKSAALEGRSNPGNPAADPFHEQNRERRDYPNQGGYNQGGYNQGGYYGRKKKKGFLGDLFDFD